MRTPAALVLVVLLAGAGSPAAERTVAGAPDEPVAYPAIIQEPLRYRVPSDILFDTDSPELRTEGRTALAEIAGKIPRDPGVTVLVEGHTDSRPSPNRRLSQQRAAAAAAVLKQNGVPGLKTRGYDDDRPRCRPEYDRDGTPNHRNMQCNRRVEIVIVYPGS